MFDQFPNVKTTADSAGVTQKSSLEPMRGKRRRAVMDAIKDVVSKKGDGKGGYGKKAC